MAANGVSFFNQTSVYKVTSFLALSSLSRVEGNVSSALPITHIIQRVIKAKFPDKRKGSFLNQTYPTQSIIPCATSRNPRGFGPPPKKKSKKNKPTVESQSYEDEEEEEEESAGQGIIPEIVTNRMMSRMAFSVGVPLGIGLLFFPLFYYLKVGLKIDVPTWIPFIVSFFFFGSALLGVSYGIVSSSWDPTREGSFLGWKEARRNWPVFWQSLRGGSTRRN